MNAPLSACVKKAAAMPPILGTAEMPARQKETIGQNGQ
jgi:hypothetical protein